MSTTTNTAITYERVVAEIGEIVAENPGCTYLPQDPEVGCRYVEYGKNGEQVPGCLIARWLHRFHGVTLDDLVRVEGFRVNGAIRKLAPKLMLSIDPRAQRFLDFLQRRQDAGQRWDAAFASLKARM